MTAEVVTIPRPRNPLLAEMMTAYETALTLPQGSRERRFYEGLGLGYAVAFGFVTREALDAARRQPGASNVHIDFRQPRFDDDEETLWACGVRHGYALGTSEQVDADECVACGERLTDDDDPDVCDDGYFCPPHINDCRAVWHQNGPAHCIGEGWGD